MRYKWKRGKPPVFRWQGGLPRLILSERHEAAVRRTTRGLTLAGIASALLGLPAIPGLGLAIALSGLQYFLEHSIFRVSFLHVSPAPKFRYDPSRWEAMAFLFDAPPPKGRPLGIGLVFNDVVYAREFFAFLRSWNDGDSDDVSDHIKLSFVTDEEVYYVYLYPSFQRPAVGRSWRLLKRAVRHRGANREPFLLVTAMVICKRFSSLHGYRLGDFVNRYRQGESFDLVALLQRPGMLGAPEEISEIEPIRKYHLKAKARVDLERDEFESVHLSRTRDC